VDCSLYDSSVVAVLSRLLRGRGDDCCLELELVLFSAAVICSWALFASDTSSERASCSLSMASAGSQVIVARSGSHQDLNRALVTESLSAGQSGVKTSKYTLLPLGAANGLRRRRDYFLDELGTRACRIIVRK
jgi:hypothetical protein